MIALIIATLIGLSFGIVTYGIFRFLIWWIDKED